MTKTSTNESTTVEYCDVQRRLDLNVPNKIYDMIPTNDLLSPSVHTQSLWKRHWVLSESTMLQFREMTMTLPIILATIMMLLIPAIMRYFIRKRNQQPKSETIHQENAEMVHKRARKQDFLTRAGEDYGYRGSKLGYIDDWRPHELPALQLPLERQTNSDEHEVYLDYAGAALPIQSQLSKIYQDCSILGNPHSTGPAASRTAERIQRAEHRVLQHLRATPGKYASLQLPTGFDGQAGILDRHPGYELLWTSGATQAFSTLAERFPFHEQSIFLYVTNSHNSVVGMRQLAMQRGATFSCIHLQDLETLKTVNDWQKLEETILGTRDRKLTLPKRHLLVFPSECNFGGDRPDAESIIRSARTSGWYTMLDIAKHSSTDAIHLKKLDPDFAALSFYKWFGDPTGVGALLVRKPAISVLFEDAKRRYQGGGSVDIMLPNTDFTVPKSQLASLKNGTSHFRGIANLVHGLDLLEKMGGMSAIHKHTTCLTKELVERLGALKHANGMPVVQLYGAWGKHCKGEERGSTVAMNVFRSDGTAVGYNEVSKLGALQRPPLQFRTGCFCNPGACQMALQIDDRQAMENYKQLGHVCGDHIDLANGLPTGAVRVSFGKESLWEDMDAFVRFIEVTFRDNLVNNTSITRNDESTTGTKAIVSELYLFPIKSCAAFQVSEWPLSLPTGKLQYDREFAIVDTSGAALRMQTCSRLGLISPTIDLQRATMRVSAPGFEDLIIDLAEDLYHRGENAVRVCGSKCNGRVWGDARVSEWFTEVLGIQCWLARYSSSKDKRPGFSNEEPILLVSEHAVATLNKVLVDQGQAPCTAKRFRPNIVIRNHNVTIQKHIEDDWKQISLGNFAFAVKGGCPRCSMVDFDPSTGQKGKTLRALASYRRRKGRILFGIFLRASPEASTPDVIWIREGDTLDCK